jgi:peptidyl-prolyl cis-trans isomerase SurA
MNWAAFTIAFATLAHGGAVIDRIAVVVGKHAIKTSDIERDLRVTQFLNNQPADASLAQQRLAVQRLIDQELIRRDLEQAGNTDSLASEAQRLLDQLRADRFRNSEAQMAAELRKRGIAPADLSQQLQWQLVVLRFIDQRFRPGVFVTEEEIDAYYRQHAEELNPQGPGADALAAAKQRVRELLEAQQVDRNLEDWLQQTRKSVRIDFTVKELQ